MHLQYEGLIFLKLPSSGIYTESIRSKFEPYSTVENCAMIIINIVKIQEVKLNRKDAVFFYLVYILAIRLRDLFDHQEL